MSNYFFVFKILATYLFQIANIGLVFIFNPSEYGELAILISISQFIFILTSGITSGATNVFSQKKFHSNRQCHEIFMYRLFFILLVILTISIIYFLTDFYFPKLIPRDDSLIFILSLALGYILYEAGTNLLYPTDKYKVQSIIELFVAILFVYFILFLVSEIKEYGKFYLITGAVSFIVSAVVYYLSYGGNKADYSFIGLKLFFIYSVWQSISVISIYLVNYGSNYVMIFNDASEESLGLFNFTQRLFFGLSAFFTVIVIVMPKLIRAGKVSLNTLNSFSAKVIAFISILYIVAAIIFKIILIYFNKEDYLDSIYYMLWLLPAFIGMAYINIVNTFLSNTSSYAFAQFFILYQAIILVIAMFFTVPYLGIYGLIISYTLSYFITSIYAFLKIRSGNVGVSTL